MSSVTLYTLLLYTLLLYTVLLYTLLLYTRSSKHKATGQSLSYRSINSSTYNRSIILLPCLGFELLPLCKLAQKSGRSPGRFRVMPIWDRDITQPGYVGNAALAAQIIIVMIISTFVIGMQCYSGAQQELVVHQPRLLGRLSSWT